MSVFEEVEVDRAGVHVGGVWTNDELIYQADGKKTLRYLFEGPVHRVRRFPAGIPGGEDHLRVPHGPRGNLEGIRELSLLGGTMMVSLGGFGGATSAEHPLVKDGKELRGLSPYFQIVKGSIEDFGHILGTRPRRRGGPRGSDPALWVPRGRRHPWCARRLAAGPRRVVCTTRRTMESKAAWWTRRGQATASPRDSCSTTSGPRTHSPQRFSGTL